MALLRRPVSVASTFHAEVLRVSTQLCEDGKRSGWDRALSASLRARKEAVTVRERDYAFEALAEVTASDPSVARGALNAALRDIRIQEPSLAGLDDSYLLSAEIHDRAKLYAQVWPEVALTPTALSKHWKRLPEEASKLKRGGTNLHVEESTPLPASRREQNLEEARKLLAKLSE